MADAKYTEANPFIPQTESIPGDDDKPFVPALLVIDMQNDFVYGSLPVPGAVTILRKVNDLIKFPGFKIKVATRDSHPEEHVSFAKTHQKPLFTKITIYHPEDPDKLMGLEQVLWPVHCVASTGGADFIPGLVVDRFDHTIYKGTHPKIESYSAFRDAWGRNETELPGLLKEKGVTDIFCVGLAGDFCVKYTAMDAAEYGYRTWVIVDGVKSISHDDVAWNELQERGVRFTKFQDVKEKVAPDEPL